jgi:hypothetical protein
LDLILVAVLRVQAHVDDVVGQAQVDGAVFLVAGVVPLLVDESKDRVRNRYFRLHATWREQSLVQKPD